MIYFVDFLDCFSTAKYCFKASSIMSLGLHLSRLAARILTFSTSAGSRVVVNGTLGVFSVRGIVPI